MHEDMYPVETAILLVGIRNDMMHMTGLKRVGFFAILNKAAEHPEEGMNPEHGKCAEQKAGHRHKGIEEERVFLPVMGPVGIIFGKHRCRLWVAVGTHFYQVVRVKIGVRIAFRQDRVGGVAVGAAGYLFREAEPVVFAVITVEIRFDGNIGYIVLLHQFFIGMALHADF